MHIFTTLDKTPKWVLIQHDMDAFITGFKSLLREYARGILSI